MGKVGKGAKRAWREGEGRGRGREGGRRWEREEGGVRKEEEGEEGEEKVGRRSLVTIEGPFFLDDIWWPLVPDVLDSKNVHLVLGSEEFLGRSVMENKACRGSEHHPRCSSHTWCIVDANYWSTPVEQETVLMLH